MQICISMLYNVHVEVQVLYILIYVEHSSQRTFRKMEYFKDKS